MNNPERALSTEDPESTGGQRNGGALSGLGEVRTELTPDEVIARLRKRSQQGKLPGFEHRGGHVFRVLAFGQPYDKELIGSVAPCPDRERGARVWFQVRVLRRIPIIVGVIVALTIWPGLWVTHSLIAAYFYSYWDSMWATAAWYVPLCVIALPALWTQYKRSMAAADEHARETVAEIAKLLTA